jgi:thiamine-phosphate pyrophosphorylase
LKFSLPKIYPITDPRISGLSHLEQVRRLIAGGARLIQLREKNAPAGEFYEAARQAVALAHELGAKIIINDRVDIALASGADGVHLGQDDLPPEHARRILGKDAIIGFSSHSLDQARAGIGLPVDYIAIGPIFATSTKSDHEPVVGLEGLRAVRELDTGFPIVAIGGINRDTIASVLAAGASSVALISGLLSDPAKISERMRDLSAAGSP